MCTLSPYRLFERACPRALPARIAKRVAALPPQDVFTVFRHEHDCVVLAFCATAKRPFHHRTGKFLQARHAFDQSTRRERKRNVVSSTVQFAVGNNLAVEFFRDHRGYLHHGCIGAAPAPTDGDMVCGRFRQL